MAGRSDQTSKAWVLAIVSLASCMVALDSLIVTTALSTIRRDLGASMETLEWTVNAYSLSFACKNACNNGSDSLLMHVDAHLAGSKGESAGG